MKSSLEAAQAMHSAYINRQLVDPALIKYIKDNIRSHEPDHLSAMIYYSAMTKCFESEMWKLYDMQITRTNTCSYMMFVSLVRTAQALARAPGDYFEAFNMIEYHVLNKIHLENDVSEISKCLHCFAGLGMGGKLFYSNMSDVLYKNKEKISLDSAVDIVWSMAAMDINTEIKEWLGLKIKNQINLLNPVNKRHAYWALNINA
jgi:hypothetical protein